MYLAKNWAASGLRFPNLKDAPDIAGWSRAMRNKALRLLERRRQSGDHAVIPFARLPRNVSGHKYGQHAPPIWC